MIDISIRHQLGDLSLQTDIQAGPGINALFGRSGCGKTTLINIIAGLCTPNEGHIIIGDRVLFDSGAGINMAPEHRRMGYVFQDARLFPHLSVVQNLTYGMDLLSPGDRRHTVEEISNLLELGALLPRQPTTLSGGERQRVAIGRALLSGPAMLLMDEPLASLDAMHKAEIMPFIERLRDELALPVFYVSHDLDEVIRLADNMIVMSNGTVAVQGSVEQTMARLDVQAFTGPHEAGAVVIATVQNNAETDGLTELLCEAGRIVVPGIDIEPGTSIRLRIRARDVSLATTVPVGSSVLNVFEGTVVDVKEVNGEPHADVLVDVGVPLISRITRRSAKNLDIKPGKTVYALVKAAAIDKPSGQMPGQRTSEGTSEGTSEETNGSPFID
ncbi:MAG: molybdenum ABC transporter ATP-binding protein [Rhodospirillales bacterium]|jgi:molybdate transport system ATP-binding protein|nr:molybdenum ABC transporter ATP-binding protein [Rhodospirillales bacterium]MBT5350408.1 molybdenum ABC transporter ATP-binding protein [Rhodospirillales bacterium]MBT5519897.1 molybdenum ABC transporter ATP-binding protein [Rhodospirillales bacterium]MBT6109174.1 molybdenum ABC transporter ATP-binding protein [Rhodospirillales bacterium]MBT6827000.1 molybdenum ABC transporter ATP-binding protein [Rhodospirillales bacterium]